MKVTPREKEVLEMISTGNQNKVIAKNLGISIHTVKNHVKSILTKLNVENRTQAAIVYVSQGVQCE